MKILELDLEGNLPDNKIVDELHRLTKIENKNDRVICPSYGTFYVESLIVRESTGKPLVEGKDYTFAHHDSEYSELTGKDLESLIIITNPNVSRDVRISYQALGGKLEIQRDYLQEKLTEINENVVTYNFEDIIGQPEGYVGDENHPHEYWQLYGWDSLIENLDRLGDGYSHGRRAVITAIEEYTGLYIDLVNGVLDEYRKYQAHLQDFNNPHQVTKVQLLLDLINNWRMADMIESSNRNIDNLYMGIHGSTSLYDSYLYPLLYNHITDFNNPHEVTNEQLDLYSIADINTLYSNRLLKTSRAHDSTLLEGRNIATFTNDVRTKIPAGNIRENTLFNLPQMVSNPTAPAVGVTYLQTGNNRLEPLEDLTVRVGREDLFRTWNYIPGVASNANTAWTSIVGTAAIAGTILIKTHIWYPSDGAAKSYNVIVGLRNADGTTARIV